MTSVKSLTSLELAAAMGHRPTTRWGLASISPSHPHTVTLSHSVLSSLAPSVGSSDDQEGGKREGDPESSIASLTTQTPAQIEQVSSLSLSLSHTHTHSLTD